MMADQNQRRRTGVVLLLPQFTPKAKHLHATWCWVKNLQQMACYLRGSLHLSNNTKIRGRCPDLCGKVKGGGGTFHDCCRREVLESPWKLRQNTELHCYFSKYFMQAFTANYAQKPPKGDRWFATNCPLYSCQTHWFTYIRIEIVQ